MTSILCRVGLHHVAYQPAPGPELWLKRSICTRCGSTIKRRHR